MNIGAKRSARAGEELKRPGRKNLDCYKKVNIFYLHGKKIGVLLQNHDIIFDYPP
jgi:hypothetical protein